MSKIVCITSMSQEYYDHVGMSCIETFIEFWPDNIELYVYNEDIAKPRKKKRVHYVSWDTVSEMHNRYAERTENKGAVKFAKKAYPIIHAMKNIECDRLIWLDADSYSTRKINLQLLELISPIDVLSTHFGVKHHWPSEADPNRMSFSCETGFFMLNKTHPMFSAFANRYEEYYEKDLGYNLRRFYDGEVYGAVVNEMSDAGVKMLDLNPNHEIKSPIPRSVIGEYISHMKAGLKDSMSNEKILENLDLKVDHE